MSLDKIETARKKTVGCRQTLKAIQKGQARVVYVALDADPRVIDPIVEMSQARSIPVVKVESMRDLGRACGISVSCASAAVTEE